MPELSTSLPTIEVVVDIKPRLASPAQEAAWRKFWQKMITEGKTHESND